ncbi:Dph6-related ATP pyrophosphatase [Psychroflexus montanilacus]|uniref:Dph6-related ATP pyrophosphatase n=1 Tax=Psychroflexus montanilacus TaxID=2873598 RepID=UPI001CCEA817|nr:diphthine--ammonia ligase [Psychroflexus montanilacus]MBZ9650967.1 diphthine--ammonia ligase [Psychroflexus montanilacus]
MKEKTIVNWSGGKDSALALYKLLQAQEHEIMCLLTNINKHFQRISMHGVRVDLLEAQAKSLDLPLVKLQLPEMPSMEVYDQMMATTLNDLKVKGATASVYGDIFLEDLRKYKESQLNAFNLKAMFPLWKIPTHHIIREFLDLGFKTITTCVNEKYLEKSFVGRVIDDDFLKELPATVDPCGENGEFHTFVFDGPIFRHPIEFEVGEIVYKTYTPANSKGKAKDIDDKAAYDPYDTGFWFCDLIPKPVTGS